MLLTIKASKDNLQLLKDTGYKLTDCAVDHLEGLYSLWEKRIHIDDTEGVLTVCIVINNYRTNYVCIQPNQVIRIHLLHSIGFSVKEAYELTKENV